MASGYSRSPKLLKGALIQFSAPMLVPIPNIIIFQYNPETMTRTLKPWSVARTEAEGSDAKKLETLLAQPYDPQESFSLTLELDAADALEFPESHPVAVVSGVADRVAAMEMLLYPPGDSALGGLLNVSVDVSIGAGGISASANTGASAEAFRKAKRKQVPIVLFFWGPGRIVPVRLTSFQVEEQAFSPLLYPIRAKVTLGLTIVNPADIKAEDAGDQTAVLQIAKACYTFTRTQKEVLATANLANSVESIVGMLPI